MKRCIFMSFVMCTLMAMGCGDDATEGLTTTCGDGVVNADEICDGEAFAEGVKVCPDGMVLKDEAAFACTATCGLDVSKACALPTCGDGILNGGEICDGEQIREDVKVCPDGMVLKEDAVFACTATCGLDISAACTVPSCEDETCQCEPAECGNHVLEDGEICDSEQIREDAKVCPEGMRLLDNAVWECTDSCLLDLTQACAPIVCGDGILDAGEACEILETGVSFAETPTCEDGKMPVTGRDLFGCSADCKVVKDDACIKAEDKQPTLYFSELYAQSEVSAQVSQHFYMEIGNLGATTPVHDCKIVGVKAVAEGEKQISVADDNVVFEYSLEKYTEKLGQTASDPTQVITVCYENEEGWMQSRYNEKTLSLEVYREVVEDASGAQMICTSTCNESEADDGGVCLKACDAAYDLIIKKVNFDGVWARHVDERCDLYIPEGVKALELTASRSTYSANNYWGIALVCGDSIHDAVALKELGANSGERYCPDNTLASITSTGAKVWGNTYFDYSPKYGLFDKANGLATIGYAECGDEVIN